MSYDHWKTTDPADEWLGPNPEEEEEQEPQTPHAHYRARTLLRVRHIKS
jgi:hypothetical protein